MEKDHLAVGREYVESARAEGNSDDEIRQALIEAGWTETDLAALSLGLAVPSAAAAQPASATDAAGDAVPFVRDEIARWRDEGLVSSRLAERLLAEYEAGPAPAPSPRAPAAAAAPEYEWPRLAIPMTPGMVLLYIGGLLILIAGFMLVSHVWVDLGPGGQFALVFLATAGVYGAGAWVHVTQPERRVAAAVMLFFGCLLIPAALFLGAKWLLGDADLGEGAWLLIVTATFAAHAGTLYRFHSPLLRVPYPLCFLWFVSHWSGLGPSARFALVVLPTVALYWAGTRLRLTKPDRRVVADQMLFVACVLVPWVLLLTAQWLLGDSDPGEAVWFLIVVATFAVHAGTFYRFRSQLLAAPYLVCFPWFAAHWVGLGPSGRFALVLLPTVALYYVGVYLHLTERQRRAAADQVLFAACLLVPWTLLLGALWVAPDSALDPGVLWVIAAVTLAIHLGTLYRFPSQLLTIAYPLTLIWLAMETVAVVTPEGHSLSSNGVGGALLASGLVLLAAGIYHAQQQKPAYALAPDVVGVLALLIGLATLGADGHHPGWEFLSFVASLGLIAGSVPQKNQIYLLAGAVFLTINIFWIGFEYFGESAGLPLTLLICGALSMAAGYMVHRVRKEHIL